MVNKNPVMIAVGRVASAQRHGNLMALVSARDELLSRKLEDAIERALHPDPPYLQLSESERQRLAEKLLAG